MKRLGLVIGIFVLFGLLIAPQRATGIDDWPVLAFTAVASGLTKPVQAIQAGDGSGRLFLVEQTGRIRISSGGTLATTPFLDIRDRVLSTGSEQGLFSIAFPSDYATKGYFYASYTSTGGTAGISRISRFRLTSTDLADKASEEILLTIDQPYTNHNGGQIAFGPDGYLYAGFGDGGSGGDPQNRAQDPSTYLGKLLRMNVEGSASPTPEIWASGLRNPWRFSFDRQTGDLYIGDVGQSALEEIDFQAAPTVAGVNYGWRRKEGTRCFNPSTNCDPGGLTEPVAEYDHSLGCSVTGGFVYRGVRYPRLQGIYLYADYCSGRVWGLARSGNTWQNQLLVDTSYSVSGFGQDDSGEIYLVDLSGSVYQVSDPTGPIPTPVSNRRQILPVTPKGNGL